MPEEIENNQTPRSSISLQDSPNEVVANLKMISEVFQKIENETAEIAEMIFDYLINAPDEQVIMGTLPPHANKRLNTYIKILNRLFLFSRKKSTNGGFRVVNRNTVEKLDTKTFSICMCYDGGVSLDILCDIVNTENRERTPSKSPVKVTIKQAFGNINQHQQE